MIPDCPHLRVGYEFNPSKYKRKGIRIYRSNVYGGSNWAFIYEDRIYLAYSLQAAYALIDEILRGKTENAEKLQARILPGFNPERWW